MPELPYIQWFTNDWMGDPQVTACSPSTRGIWFDFLNHMHQLGRTGKLSGTRETMSRYGRCSATELGRCLSELIESGVGQVQEVDGVVTVINRRMSRDHENRAKDAERKRNARDRDSVRGPSGGLSAPNSTQHPAYGDGDGDSSGEPTEGGLGETQPITPEDLAEIGDWLSRVSKVQESQKLKDAILRHHYTLNQLKTLWKNVVDSRGIKNRPAFFVSQIQNGTRVKP